MDDCTFNYSGTGRLFSTGGGNIILNGGTLINITGNNGVVFGVNNKNTTNVTIGFDIGTINAFTGVRINAGVATGIRLGTITKPCQIKTGFPSYLTLLGAVDISNGQFQFANAQAINIKQSDFIDANFDILTTTGVSLVIGHTRPLRFLDVNSLSADGAFVTKKKLVVNELWYVIPITDTAGDSINDEQTATVSQTVFTVPTIPAVVIIKAYKGGILLPKASYSGTGTTITYVPASNGGINFIAGDRANFIY